jgi:ATP-binding cassette subfamily B protein
MHAVFTLPFKKGDPFNEARINRFTLRQYFEAMRYYKVATVTILVTFGIATTGFTAILPYILAHVVDLLGHPHASEFTHELVRTLSLAAGVVVIAAASNAIGLRTMAYLDSRAMNYIRAKVIDHLLHESAAFYATNMAGSLTSNVVAFVNGFGVMEDIFFIRGLNLLLPMLVSLGIVAWQSLPLAAMFLVVIGITAAKTLIDSRKRVAYRRARKKTMSVVNGFVGDIITNNAAVRIFAGELHEAQGLQHKQKAWQRAAQKNLQVFAVHYISLVASINLLQVAGIGFAGWLAATGKVSLGLVVFAIAYFQRLSSGLLELAPMVQTYQGALMDAAPIGEILAKRPLIFDVPRAKKLRSSRGELVLTNVTYRYDLAEPAIFEDLSLHIPAGQSVGIVGRSGGGKTTLTNLLLRFADVESGNIAIDGQNICEVTQQSLRNAISYVPQDSQLFHRSIRENIAYGKPNASDAQVIAAAKRAHIWEYIKMLPDGLATKVGERGVKLSGGQRQRVAIARAILKDAPILVFDEATSALDSESEQRIQASLDALMKGRTSIVIAHRLSTIQKMDRIIVLDKGTIVEDGTHAQLLRKKGLYASLWRHQTGGFINE